MDDRFFDAWVRGVATRGISRRGGLRLAVGAGMAALLGQAVMADAAACRKDGNECSRPGQCCSGKCKGSGDKQTCRRAKNAFGCKARQDACRGGETPCPRREGSCFQLDGGEAFCAGLLDCTECQNDGDCPVLPVAVGRPRCIRNCAACSGGSVCVYPNLPT